MRATMAGLLVATALLGAAPASAGDSADAWATIELTAADQRRGAASLLDDQWIADLIDRAAWREFLVDAAKESKLADTPEFKGMSAVEIGWISGVTVKMERREGPGIVAVHTSGSDAARCVAISNAVARWIVGTASLEGRQRQADRRTQLQGAFSINDAQIHLLSIDRASAIANPNFTEATFDLDVERLTDYRRARGNEADEMRRALVLDEANYKDLKAALSAGTVEILANHIVVLRDDGVRDLAEAIEDRTAERDDLAASGIGKDHPDLLKADRMVARALSAYARAVRRVAARFVGDYEDRHARLQRAEADLAGNTRQLVAAMAVRRQVESINAEIERRTQRKASAGEALEELMSSESNDAIRVLTEAGPAASQK